MTEVRLFSTCLVEEFFPQVADAVVPKKLALENEAYTRIAEFPKPTIAALNGLAFGGGLELAACCDLIIAETGTMVALPEIKLALTEDGYYHKEGRYGRFERHVSVPRGVKEAEIKAEYVNGVLEISLPRLAKASGAPKPKEILVKSRSGH